MPPVLGPPGQAIARSPRRSLLCRALASPAANVAIFAFLLNHPWEFLQVPLFRDMPTAPHWEAIKVCTQATFGDAVITMVAFWGVAAMAGTQRWVLHPRLNQTAMFVAIGLAATIVLERLAVGPLHRWAYAETMPIVPVLGIGLAPMLQWIVLPPLVMWFVRRQLT